MKPRSISFRSILQQVTIGLAALSCSASAAVVLAVDVGSSAGVQPGFQAFDTAIADSAIAVSQTFGAYSVSFTGGVSGSNTGYLNLRDRWTSSTSLPLSPRNADLFTQEMLLRERIVANGGTTGLVMTITGLAANTEYQLQIWGFDTQASGGAKAGTNIFWDNTPDIDGFPNDYELGRYTMTAGQMPDDNNDFSITVNVTTDATGQLVIKSYNNTGANLIDGPGIINGFVLSSIPEPSSFLLAIAGCGMFLGIRRRI